jgi:hypothetical protein
MNRRRSRVWAACLALGVLGCLAAAATLTKDDVIAMARSGRSQQDILAAVRDAHASFDLTADDIADLRRSGVGEDVIQAMVDTEPPQTDLESAAPPASEAGPAPDEGAVDEGAYDQGPLEGPYAPPAWYAYPYYPLYYPVYYPVYDPFWPYFGGFFVSFEFVHFSHCFSVFSCDRSFVVVNRPVSLRGGSIFSTRPAVFTTPRTQPRGSTVASLSGFGSRPARLTDPRGSGGWAGSTGPRGQSASSGTTRPRGMLGPRGATSPRAAMSPRAMTAPRSMTGSGPRSWTRPEPPLQRPLGAPAAPRYGMPRGQAAPRSFGPAPRFSSPPRPSPGFAPMPRGGYGGGGGFHAAPAPRGGGHSHGGHN